MLVSQLKRKVETLMLVWKGLVSVGWRHVISGAAVILVTPYDVV